MLPKNPEEERKLVEWFIPSETSLPRIPQRLSDGCFELAFPSEVSRKEQLEHCQQTVTENCIIGGRSGCSVNAIRACRPSWLETVFRKGSTDEIHVTRCEENYMTKCLQEAKGKCASHSKHFCEIIFTSPN